MDAASGWVTVFFGANLLLLSFNAGILWTKVNGLMEQNREIKDDLDALKDGFNFLSGQLSTLPAFKEAKPRGEHDATPFNRH